MHRSTSRQGNGTEELQHTMPYHLQQNNTRKLSMVHIYHIYVRTKNIEKNKERNRKEKILIIKKHKGNKTDSNVLLGRRPSSQGTRMLCAVSWFDQSHDMSTRKDQTEDMIQQAVGVTVFRALSNCNQLWATKKYSRSCHVMSRHVMSMSCHAMPCHVISSHLISCHLMPYHVMSCHVCHAMPCHFMSCHVMSCHV